MEEKNHMGWVIYITTHNDIATACNEVDDHFMLMEYGKRKRSRPPPGFASIFSSSFWQGGRRLANALRALYYLVHLSMTPNSVYL